MRKSIIDELNIDRSDRPVGRSHALHRLYDTCLKNIAFFEIMHEHGTEQDKRTALEILVSLRKVQKR